MFSTSFQRHSLEATPLRWLAGLVVAGVLGTAGMAAGAPNFQPPRESGAANTPLPELEGVDIDAKLGAKVPFGLEFTDDRGATIRVGDLFGQDPRPVLLTFNYSNCPLLCGVQLGALVEALAKMEFTPGQQYRIVTVGLDPKETPQRAADSKAGYLDQLAVGRERARLPEASRAAVGWTFLVGAEASVRALADSVGFGYRYLEKRNEYLHPAAFMVLTKEGTVAQYIHGVSFDHSEITAAITSAVLGLTTESGQDFVMSCYRYDPEKGVNSFRIMQLGGGFFALFLVLAITTLHLRSRSKARKGQKA